MGRVRLCRAARVRCSSLEVVPSSVRVLRGGGHRSYGEGRVSSSRIRELRIRKARAG